MYHLSKHENDSTQTTKDNSITQDVLYSSLKFISNFDESLTCVNTFIGICIPSEQAPVIHDEQTEYEQGP